MSSLNGRIAVIQRAGGIISGSNSITGTAENVTQMDGCIDSINNVNGNVNEASNIYVEEIKFDDYMNFPEVGADGVLYIATDEANRGAYYYDSDTGNYVSLAEPDKTYVYNQLVPSDIWTVNHNMNKYPSVTIVDSANNVLIGDISYTSGNQLSILFSSPFAGKAYLN